MRYTINLKTAQTGSKYATAMVLLGILAMGLLVYDARASNSLMVLKWVLYSVFGIK